MKSQIRWRAIAEGVGVVAIVGSLIFVGLQIQQDQQIALAQIFADHDDTQREWARMIVENDDVWVRGLKGEDLDEREFAKFTALSIAYFQMEADRYRRAMLITAIQPTSIIVKHANIISSYPGLETVWVEWLEESQGVSAADWFDDYRDSVTTELRAIQAGDRDYKPHTNFAPM